MKQFLFLSLTIILVILTSCRTEHKTYVTIERVPCEIHASVVTPIVDETPISRATAPADRIIKYKMVSSDNSDVIEDVVKVNNPIYVDLLKGKTYKMVFFFSESKLNDNIAIVTDEHMYRAEKVVTITESLTETITLKRNIGQFVAKAGNMPQEAKLNVSITAYNHYDWYNNSLYRNDGSEFHQVYESLLTSESVSIYGIPNETPKSVTVNVEIEKNGNVIKSAVYQYVLKANVKYTVTYNINNVNPDGSEFGDFVIDIDERWDEATDDNQQIKRSV